MKQQIIEILSAIVIIIISIFSFTFAFDTFTGRSLMQIVIRDRILIDQYSATRAYIVLGVSLVLGILSLALLLYPIRHELYSSFNKGLSPIFNKMGFVIVGSKIRRKS